MNEEEMIEMSLRDIIDEFVIKESKDGYVNLFIHLNNDEKIIDSELLDVDSINYKGKKIVYGYFINEFDDKILEYIEQAENPELCRKVLYKLVQDTILILINNDHLEAVKSKESEYTKVSYIINLTGDYTREERSNIVLLILMKEMYNNGYIDEFQYKKFVGDNQE